MTLRQLLKCGIYGFEGTILAEDCPYAIVLDMETFKEFQNRIVLGFDTKFNDDGDIVLDWVKVAAEVEEEEW